jgi:hypothetical protein
LKFLGRARRFLQELASEPESKVQYFNVTCVSGHRVRGERTEGYQALRCPACGEGVFVLPRSPLPDPAAPGRAPASTRASRGRAWTDDGPVELTDPGRAALEVADDEAAPADAEIIWDDPPAQPARRPGRNRGRDQDTPTGAVPAGEDAAFWEEDITRAAAANTTERSGRRREKPAPEQRAAAASSSHGRRRRAAEPAVIEVDTRPKKRSPITAIVIVVPLLVATAVAWRYWRQVRAQYPLTAELGRTEGIPALEQGNFDKAYQLLSAAKTAVTALGGAVDDADEICTAADEAAIFVDLSPRILEEILEEAARTDPLVWPTKFNDLYKGRAIVIETTITEEPGAGSSDRYLVDYLVLPSGAAYKFNQGTGAAPDRFGMIDFTGFELFDLARPHKGEHKTFGARLASFQLDKISNVWWVGLEPKSGVFILHPKALEAMGWPRGGDADMSAETPR